MADGTFGGYASLFDKVDLGKDKVQRGAFRDSLAQRGAYGIRMLFQHDPAEPIGTWTYIREDEKGLFVSGKITQGSRKGREVLELMRSGAIDGLSIGFRTKKSATDRRTGIRTITEVDLWEVSVVTFPLLPQARISDVKAAMDVQNRQGGLPTIRQFERWLTQDAGLTRSEARTVIAKGFANLTGRRDAAEPQLVAIADRLRRATRIINSKPR